MKRLRVYFAGSITGGRDFEKYYWKIANLLKQWGHQILTEHVVDFKLQQKLRQKAQKSVNYFSFIAKHNKNLMHQADLLIAECSQGSLGTGFEICYAAYVLQIPVITLRYQKASGRASATIFGDDSGLIYPYFYNDRNIEEVLEKALAEIKL